MLIELQERKKRASNVLIFGAEECTEENRENRAAYNSNIINKVISISSRKIDIDDLKFFRLGKYEKTKRRPIKVIFPSKEDAEGVLHHKNKIPKEGGIYLKYDQTEMQRTYLKKLINELEEKEKQGFKDQTIKYFDGIPKIIKKQNILPFQAKNITNRADKGLI